MRNLKSKCQLVIATIDLIELKKEYSAECNEMLSLEEKRNLATELLILEIDLQQALNELKKIEI